MRKSKVLTKALAAILCIAMLIPMAVTVGAAETGSEPQATISVSTKRLSMTDQREVALSFNLGYKSPRRPTWSGPSATSPSASG